MAGETAAQKKTREAEEAEAALAAATEGDASTGAPEGDEENWGDPEQVEVHVAYMRVMRKLRAIAKGEKTTGGAKFSFRGVDTVMNAVGPALREHGVLIWPSTKSLEHRDIPTNSGGTQHEVIVEMAYTIIGPMGDTLEGGGAYGEAADSSDKATSQAQSVAYRVFWIQSLCIPVGDPEPDENHIERGSARSDGGSRGEASSSRGRSTDPAPAASNESSDAERAAAVAAGWARGPAERLAAWNALIKAQQSIDANFCADILAWGRSQVEDAVAADSVFDETTLTLDQAKSWQVLIDRARAAEAKAVEEGFGEGVHQEQQYADDEEPF